MAQRWAGPPLTVGRQLEGGERTLLSVVEGVAFSPPGASQEGQAGLENLQEKAKMQTTQF